MVCQEFLAEDSSGSEKPRVHWTGVVGSVLSQIRATLRIRARAMKQLKKGEGSIGCCIAKHCRAITDDKKTYNDMRKPTFHPSWISAASLSLWLTLFNNQNDFDLRVDKQLDSTRQQRSGNAPSLSAPWPWLWLPPGVLPMGKLVSLLGNPSKKGLHHLHGLPGTCYWWEAARHPASHRAWNRNRSAIPRAILQTSPSKSTIGMQGNRQKLPKEAPKDESLDKW